MVRRTRNGAKLCERPPCARGMPRAQLCPKKSAPTTPSQNRPAEKGQNEGWAIALVAEWRELVPPDSEWGKTLRAASVYPGDAPGTAAPKNERPKAPVPKPASGKGPKRGVGYSLGGGLGPTSSAGLRMGRDFAYGIHVPKIGRGHVRAQKRAPECRAAQNPPAEKWTKNGWDIALVGGWGELRPPGSEWGETLRAASVCQK